ncbi:hypothetical protein LJR225_004192 [Phenylobacterium sp. LjRoot225]|uniref:hypothetical protein n=1 Tax=Phenylobacterium sp. LjRoot225 TaxID=3342285 RepID=UPI003ECCA440
MDQPTWRGSLADMLFEEFASSTGTFRDLVVSPACEALSAHEPAEGIGTVLDLDDYKRAQSAREARKALALAMAGLWESHFREHMWKSVAIFGKDHDVTLARFDKARIPDLEDMFCKLRGFALTTLAPYQTIAELLEIANAARHGNGRSSEAAFRAYPQYFSESRPHAGWYSYFLHGATPLEDVRHIDVSDDQLFRFAHEIIAFWVALREKTRPMPSGSFSGPSV